MSEPSQSSPIPLIRVSVSEAAKLFGLSDKTIRTALKNKEIKFIVIKGRYKINFESLLAWTQSSSRRQNKLQRHGIGKYVKQWDIDAPS
ncbi:MAG: helix-turn-helix domain-containing protein [Patescibacteria group bacterium]